MKKFVYGKDMAGYFAELGNPKLARIFSNIGEDALELSQALNLARHNGCVLKAEDIQKYAWAPKKEKKAIEDFGIMGMCFPAAPPGEPSLMKDKEGNPIDDCGALYMTKKE